MNRIRFWTLAGAAVMPFIVLDLTLLGVLPDKHLLAFVLAAIMVGGAIFRRIGAALDKRLGSKNSLPR